MSPEDAIKDLYLSIIKSGWTLRDIDDCSIMYLIQLMAYADKQQDKKEKVTIDEMF